MNASLSLSELIDLVNKKFIDRIGLIDIINIINQIKLIDRISVIDTINKITAISVLTSNTQPVITGFTTRGYDTYLNTGFLYGQKFTQPYNGTLQSLSFFCNGLTPPENVGVCLYSDGGNVPANRLIAKYTTVGTSSEGWVTVSVNVGDQIALTAGVAYWIVFEMDTFVGVGYNDGGGSRAFVNNWTYGTAFPAAWPAGSTSDNNYQANVYWTALCTTIDPRSIRLLTASDVVTPVVTKGDWLSALPNPSNLDVTLSSVIAALGSPFQVGGSIGNSSFGATLTEPVVTGARGKTTIVASLLNQSANATLRTVTAGKTFYLISAWISGRTGVGSIDTDMTIQTGSGKDIVGIHIIVPTGAASFYASNAISLAEPMPFPASTVFTLVVPTYDFCSGGIIGWEE